MKTFKMPEIWGQPVNDFSLYSGIVALGNAGLQLEFLVSDNTQLCHFSVTRDPGHLENFSSWLSGELVSWVSERVCATR